MGDTLRLGASFVDYLLVVVYLAVVRLIGVAARRRVPDSLDVFLSGRSLPGLVTGLAFISATWARSVRRVDSCRAGKLVGPVLWAAEADSGAGVNALTIGEAPGGFREKVALGLHCRRTNGCRYL